ncbi:aminomethyl-transferring glycine dehydrogenase [Flammeovirga sp. EKP202]|uniref:aminomethyl-transferring glycine dehydrogenase n=1 Tax=Flammeovirga sp. EKP202 TaxID=2770592 RepID=UPI00165EC7E2|nr:aminomethyl-transferring glycine dehydrogenase [Flammeovirga sp. EKP202]MBD0401111.1 aminomethyl-transferring glycine dehydrogenase [Flammeovirga sp. EKP202]
MKIDLNNFERFEARHNAPNHTQIEEMLKALGVSDIDELISQTVPEKIRLKEALNLPEPLTEYQFLRQFKEIAQKNKVYRSYIGMGYYNTITPPVILRNIMENPGWYTAYTPYQAEIAQGRLEMLLNFQTMVTDLTGMELANASLLDEATAAGEVVHMFHGARKGAKKKQANKFFAANTCHPQTLDLLKTRCTPIGVELVIGDVAELDVTDPTLFGVLVQYPDTNGAISDYTDFIAAAHENGVLVAMASDLLALTLLKEPGKMDADAVVGSAQRFGVPMGYGGPHAGFLATRDAYKRQIPGRIIGISKDKDGNEAYRMALQTREQHIKRERATSNICTAQVLLGVMAAAYAIYHGPEGLKTIAYRTHGMANLLVKGVEQLGFEVESKDYFDTIKIKTTPLQAKAIRLLAEERMANFRYFEDGAIGLSMNQSTDVSHIEDIVTIFQDALDLNVAVDVQALANDIEVVVPSVLQRESEFLTHPVFSQYHAEHEMLRYLKRLENKDLSLVHSMISLGSCTMKLNATAEMIPVTWPEFGQLHPFAPKEQAQGYQEIFKDLEAWLCEITGFDAMSLQPNSGANGEYAGLLTIRAYHEAQGEGHRNIAIIPSSAHGTNPASAVMAGMKVVIVKCDEAGNIDVEDLKAKVEQHSANLSSLMITYPSTHGVFEESVIEICQIIHDNGGRVYMDGANMNAQVGLTSPANIGADVCHLNLHKTFCIPHGGGGPGVGPIGVVADLAPYLPGHAVIDNNVGENAASAVSAAPWGSASILPISYAYIRMMGAEGLTNATKVAILNANYMQSRLKEHYPVLYVGANGRNAHEMIVDCRQFKPAGIEVEDIAKRLMDYGYHAPTVSFPVPGTLMIEPTESESKAELDQFCDAMIAIRQEIQEVIDGKADAVENVLKNAPHTQAMTITGEWTLPYSREKAVYPLPYVQANKFWPTVRRIDSAFGDRNLICACIPVSDYEEAEA